MTSKMLLEQYMAERRALGFSLKTDEGCIRRFLQDFVDPDDGDISFTKEYVLSHIGNRRNMQTNMLLYLGVISRENMQLEGFWYYLFLGVFEAATIHYAVAKIFGPLLFGRGWCGYACWTAMVLDFLPYKQPQKPRKEKLGVLRYVMFALSLALVSGLFLMKVANLEQIMFWLFLAGNTLYYIAGVALAFAFKDNRAFCKYLCPITVFLKPMSFFSLLRVHCDEDKCVHCGKCLRVCPMNVEVNKESRKRKNGTECILCYECTKVCPTKALH